MFDIGLVLRAAKFAAEKHRKQRRSNKGRSPYIEHPIEVARILAEEGAVDDPVVLAAAMLHDTIEDTETTYPDLVSEFGHEVADLVSELTDDKSLSKEERKRQQVERAPGKSNRAKMIKLADKTSNLRDIVKDPPVQWNHERRKQYAVWADQVGEGLRGVNERLEASFDQAVADAHRL